MVNGYVLGGLGLYHRIIQLTSPSVGYATICDRTGMSAIRRPCRSPDHRRSIVERLRHRLRRRHHVRPRGEVLRRDALPLRVGPDHHAELGEFARACGGARARADAGRSVVFPTDVRSPVVTSCTAAAVCAFALSRCRRRRGLRRRKPTSRSITTRRFRSPGCTLGLASRRRRRRPARRELGRRSEQVAARVDPVIIPAVEREMTARGFTRAAERRRSLRALLRARHRQAVGADQGSFSLA